MAKALTFSECSVFTCCSLSVATLCAPNDLASYNRSLSSANTQEEKRSPVGRLDFKSSKGRQPILGGFDSHSLPLC